MNENWMALYAAIVNKKLTVDKALRSLGINFQTGVRNSDYKRIDVKDEEIEEMIRLRQEQVPYKEIAEMFGASRQVIYSKIKKYKERMGIA